MLPEPGTAVPEEPKYFVPTLMITLFKVAPLTAMYVVLASKLIVPEL